MLPIDRRAHGARTFGGGICGLCHIGCDSAPSRVRKEGCMSSFLKLAIASFQKTGSAGLPLILPVSVFVGIVERTAPTSRLVGFCRIRESTLVRLVSSFSFVSHRFGGHACSVLGGVCRRHKRGANNKQQVCLPQPQPAPCAWPDVVRS